MDVSATCELIRTAPGAFLLADHVRCPAGNPAFRPVPHFHPQAELVWFRKVTGEIRLDGQTHPLADGQAVYLPPMQVHAFATGTGARDWVLIQFDPALIEGRLHQPPFRSLARPALLSPAPDIAARIDLLCTWLAGIAGSADRMAEAQRLLDLILILLADGATKAAPLLPDRAAPPDRLRDVLAAIHAAPGTAPSLAQAAAIARLSPATFSRRFKATIGLGYAAYLQMHRLNLAARHLLTDPGHVAQVAYGLGFSSAAHFSTLFTRRFGTTPRDWRRRAGLPPGPAQKNENE
ncbi:hypothetical protein C0V75_11975 [Tabrizicola sp. TH137]|uniref:AraC family transcriptional regulator n=1 Tax=Tabrizicola sp. TH137 TaxID=2067452 RepID=UPI000C7DC4AF|nr:AraC family transcriptional regulator [Tabrizicola sp. TH137]PLL12633.1 hypothetical protein C0V75_11975 [Tabrizicola sp. TH137]